MSERLKAEFGSLWRESAPLILASKSRGRAAVLAQTGIPFETEPADVDERAIEARIRAAGGSADAVAEALAGAKAATIAAHHPESFVLGADQVASCEDRIFGKPADRAAAAAQLRTLRGKTHRLHSAIALRKGEKNLLSTVSRADLAMRAFDDAFLNAYLDAAGPSVTTTAGAYQIEGLGVHLFDAIHGDHWTIMGLPLLPLLAVLRQEGALIE
jgi:septum formation protein